MDNWFSSNSNVEKEVDATGEITNTFLINSEPIDVTSLELVIPVIIICIIKMIEMTYFLYKIHQRGMKKNTTIIIVLKFISLYHTWIIVKITFLQLREGVDVWT